MSSVSCSILPQPSVELGQLGCWLAGMPSSSQGTLEISSRTGLALQVSLLVLLLVAFALAFLVGLQHAESLDEHSHHLSLTDGAQHVLSALQPSYVGTPGPCVRLTTVTEASQDRTRADVRHPENTEQPGRPVPGPRLQLSKRLACGLP